MSFRILLGFLPWILFYVLPHNSLKELKLGLTGLLILAILVSYKDLKRKFILSWCTLIFFTFIFTTIVIFNINILATYMGILVNVALTLVTLGSLAVGKPFTLQYARLEVPKERWAHPSFTFINQVITFAWGVSFSFNLGVNIVQRIHPLSLLTMNILLHSSTLSALIFTLWFPKWYRKKFITKTKH